MNDIERIEDAIQSFFSSSGQEQLPNLCKALERCYMLGHTHYYEAKMKDEKLKGEFQALEVEIKTLAENIPPDRDAAVRKFQDLTRRILRARRATYPLENPERPWEIFTPDEALMNVDDSYTFSMVDSLADDIAELQSPLYQLAIEGEREEIPTDKAEEE